MLNLRGKNPTRGRPEAAIGSSGLAPEGEPPIVARGGDRLTVPGAAAGELRGRPAPTAREGGSKGPNWLVTHAIPVAVSLCLSLVALLTAFVMHTYGGDESLRSYVRGIEAGLHRREALAAAAVGDTAFLQQQIYGLSRLSTEDAIVHADRLGQLSMEAFSIVLYEGDSVLFWTNNLAVLPPQLAPQRLPPLSLRVLGNGQYLVKRQSLRLFGTRSFEAVTLIPIRHEYALSSEYLKDGFVETPYIPEAVGLVTTPTAFGITALDGQTVAYLTRLRPFKDWRYQAWMFGLHVLILLIAGVLLFQLATYVKGRYGPLSGALSILAGALVLDRLVATNDLSTLYPDLGFLAQMFDTNLMNGSLASFMVEVVIAMWLVTFFHRSYQGPKSATGWCPLAQWGVTSLHYFAIGVAATWLTLVIKSIIQSPGIEFDFENVLNLSRPSMFALIAMLTLMFAHFLFSHRLMLGVSAIGLSKQARFTALLTALAIAAPILRLIDLPLPIPQFLLGLMIFMLVYDLFIDTGESNILWLFFWLVVLSIYSAALFFTFSVQKDIMRRAAYARVLADPHDPAAEVALLKLDSSIRHDLQIQNLLLDAKAVTLRPEAAEALQRLLIEESYLYNNYKFQVLVGNPPSEETPATKPGAKPVEPDVTERFQGGASINENLRLDLRYQSEPMYLLKLTSNPRRNYGYDAYLEVRVGPRAPSKFLTELLINEPYRGLEHLRRYDYAIYSDGALIHSQGGNPSANLRAANVPSAGESRSRTNSSYSELLYSAPGNTVVFIGMPMGGYLRPISLFSYLFVWCIILTLIMSLLNTWVDILPKAVDISWVSKPDLKTKIQVGIIALVLLSFAMIGYVTVLYFHSSTDAYHDDRLNRKVTSILENVEHEIDLMSETGVVTTASLAKIVLPISRIHSMDINLFSLNGKIAATSESEVFNRGVIAPRMGAYARQLLSDRGSAIAQQFESIGELRYRTAYVPVRNVDGKAIAYMGLPYYSKQRDLRDDVSAFMGTLLNVYVFLLLIAGVIAITVANSITQPLTELGDKIRRFRMEDKIQPLEWRAQDELGDLIHEFNAMLFTVESSAKELDNARRDSAWREMAQQVAHEIKNPLTPMKLSIEFLRHAFERSSDAAELEPMIKRVSATLIEQIDNLAYIATNFSTFARMPEPVNSLFQLNELVESVYNLFLEENVDSHLYLDPNSCPVYADKKLLMRVLNNLIKNAIQAIPTERRGELSVSLEQIGHQAVICIADNGGGIAEEMQEKVFFPKFTTKSSGSGLGLAICRDIIHAAHGRIYFETIIGVGTKFFVTLPICEADDERLAISDDDDEVLYPSTIS